MSCDTQIGFYKMPQRIGLFSVSIDEGSANLFLVHIVNELVSQNSYDNYKFFKPSNRSIAWKTRETERWRKQLSYFKTDEIAVQIM